MQSWHRTSSDSSVENLFLLQLKYSHLDIAVGIPLPTVLSDGLEQQTVPFAINQVFSIPLPPQPSQKFFLPPRSVQAEYFSHKADVRPHFSDAVLTRFPDSFQEILNGFHHIPVDVLN